MTTEGRLTAMLNMVENDQPGPLPDDFMQSVWERAGVLRAQRDRWKQTALVAGLVAVGLGTGIGTVQMPVQAKEPTYLLAQEAHLSPAALLHFSR